MVATTIAAVTLASVGVLLAVLWQRGRSSPEYVSLAETAREVWETQDSGAATLDLDVEQDAAVYADPGELTGLLDALYENALEHGPADGTVRLERNENGFAVADDGPGIPEPEREQVFEFGYSTEPEHDGLGLGLVHSICQSRDWEVTITDSNSGGARIEFTDVEFLDSWEDTETDTDGPESRTYITDVAEGQETEDHEVDEVEPRHRTPAES